MGLFSSLFNKKSALDGRGDLFQFYDGKFETCYYVRQSFQRPPEEPHVTRFIVLIKQKRRTKVDYHRRCYAVNFLGMMVRLESSEVVMDNGTVLSEDCSKSIFLPVLSNTLGEAIYYAAIRGYFATYGSLDSKIPLVTVYSEKTTTGHHIDYSILPQTVKSSPESNERDYFIGVHVNVFECDEHFCIPNQRDKFIYYMTRPLYNSIRIVGRATHDYTTNKVDLFDAVGTGYYTVTEGTLEYNILKATSIIWAGNYEFSRRPK